MSFQRVITISALAAAVLAAAILPAAAQGAAQGSGPAGQELRRCVSGALSQLARSQTPETQVGRTVTSQCDRQIRATLEESIKLGQAGNCTVDGCLALARQRTSDEATAAYRSFRR